MSPKCRPGRTTSTFIRYLFALHSRDLHYSVQLSRCLVRTRSLPCWALCPSSLLIGNDIQVTSVNYCERPYTLLYGYLFIVALVYITVLTVACPLAARFDKPLATPIVIVLKGDDQLRICGDYSVTVNPHLDVNQYPLPKPDDLFAILVGGQKFSKLDIRHAYSQMELGEICRDLCTINTPLVWGPAPSHRGRIWCNTNQRVVPSAL